MNSNMSSNMSTVRHLEYRITRQLLHRREHQSALARGGLAGRLITAAAMVAAMLLLGSYLQELLWALLAAGVVLTLGTRTD
jgi:hypothetical protein